MSVGTSKDLAKMFGIDSERLPYIKAKVVYNAIHNEDLEDNVRLLYEEFSGNELAFAMYILGRTAALGTHPDTLFTAYLAFHELGRRYKGKSFEELYERFKEAEEIERKEVV